jgi:hypothetical protein
MPGLRFDDKYLWDCQRLQAVPPGRGFSAWLPRHFVPGYYQPVPPGQKPFAHRKASHAISAYGVETLGLTLG